MPRFRILALLSTLACATACGGGDNLVLPNEGLPHDITVVAGANQMAPVGAPLPDSIVVRVTDAMNRPVAGQRVAFSVVGATSGSVGTDTAVTNADGRAGVRWTLGPTAGAQTLNATVVGSTAPLSVLVTATAGAGGLASFTAVRGNAQTATAGSLLPDSLVVRATDANSNPVAGVNVAWVITGGGIISATTTVTGPDGLTGVLWTLGPSAGPQSTTATASGAAAGQILFTATATVGAAGRLTITQQPSATAQSSVPFAQQPKLQVRDANGNPVEQAGLAVTASIASGPVGATITGSTTAATDSHGLATFSGLGIGGSGGTYTLNFGGAGLQGITSSGITIAAGAATRLVLATQPSSTAESGAVLDQQPVIQLVDASGNPSAEAGVPVTAAIATGGGTLGGTVTRSTGANGQATFTDLSIAGSAGTRTLVFFSGGLSAATSGPIAVSAAPVSASQSTVSAAPSSFTAGSGASTITVVAKDAAGGRVSGAGVTLLVTGSGNTVSTPAPTDANGTTTATLQSTGAGTKTITATINGVAVSDMATVTVSPAAPSATTSTAVASLTSVAVNQSSTVTVTVLDQYGNPVPGAAVTLAAAGATIVQPVGTTGADGVSTGTVSSSNAGTLTVTVTVNGSLQLTAQPTITVSAPPVSGSGSSVTANPTTIPASDGTATTTVTVTVRDASATAIPNATVTLSATGSGNAITPATATSDGSGVATFAFSSTVAETKTLTATANGAAIDQDATVSVTPAAPSAAQSSASVPKSGSRNHLTSFTVQLRDAFANKLRQSGGFVTATVTGQNAGALVLILDNLNGTYNGSYLPTAPGHGADFINIFLQGTAIGGSPYTSNL